MSRSLRSLRVLLALAAGLGPVTVAHATQFSYLDAAYQQEIYNGPLVGGPGMAWTSSGNLLTRNGSQLLEYSPTTDSAYLSTGIHSVIATHNIAGMLFSNSYGMVNGHDGYIYATTGTGLQRIDPTTWTVTTPGADLPGSTVSSGYTWGITVLPNGKIVYIAGASTNLVYVYDPVLQTNALIYTAPTLIDDIEASPTGEIALAAQGNNSIIIITDTGSVLTTVNGSTANNTAGSNYADGLAFGWGTAATKLFSNDNQGTITEYDFNVGYTTLLSSQTIASGGSYGDLAAVGPDCSLYVSQFYNGGYNGSALFGTNWNAGTNNDPSIVRISAKDGSCAFSTSGGNPTPVAEPGGVPLLAAGLALLAMNRRRRAVATATAGIAHLSIPRRLQ